MREDALALTGDEGRGQRRYASGRRKQSVIRGFPNGGIHLEATPDILS